MEADLIHLIHLLPEPSFLLTGGGEILFGNAAAGEFIGGEHRSLTGVAFSSLVSDHPEKVADYLKLCARSRQFVPGSLNLRTAGGKDLECRVDGTVVAPRSNGAPATLFIRCRPKAEATDQFVLLNQKIAELSKEILERKKAEQQRDELLQNERAARLEAERHSRMKDEFLATLSHELRTPLNAILGWSQLLRRSATGAEDLGEGLEIIERNAQVQKQLIEDLLDMSSIISGKVRLDVQRVDLVPVIEAAAAAVRPAAEAKGIRLQMTLDPLAGPVKGDPNRLQQVIWNLLANSIKFTHKGGRVQLFLERVNSHLEICVSDTGEGIRPEFLPLVFDRFRQADASTTRRHGGLGLGLSIVKHLVELHGGSVRAKSPGPGMGATFIVMLPLLVLHDEDEEISPGAAGALRVSSGEEAGGLPSLRGVTVLVVDDEPDARDLVKRLLQQQDATVFAAGSASEAMQAIAEHHPDILISDIGMPGTDGYELVRQVRALPSSEGGGLSAVALTAFARTEDRTRAMLAGYNVHLSKPVEPVELVATIASLAGRTGRDG